MDEAAAQRKFLVRIEGRNLRVAVEGTDGGRRTASGFYATRFVKAKDATSAADTAMDVVLSELRGLDTGGPASPPELTIDEVREDADAFDKYAPGGGFTWF